MEGLGHCDGTGVDFRHTCDESGTASPSDEKADSSYPPSSTRSHATCQLAGRGWPFTGVRMPVERRVDRQTLDCLTFTALRRAQERFKSAAGAHPTVR